MGKTLLRNEISLGDNLLVVQSAFQEEKILIANLTLFIGDHSYSAKVYIKEFNKLVVEHHFKYNHEKVLFNSIIKANLPAIKDKLLFLCQHIKGKTFA